MNTAAYNPTQAPEREMTMAEAGAARARLRALAEIDIDTCDPATLTPDQTRYVIEALRKRCNAYEHEGLMMRIRLADQNRAMARLRLEQADRELQIANERYERHTRPILRKSNFPMAEEALTDTDERGQTVGRLQAGAIYNPDLADAIDGANR